MPAKINSLLCTVEARVSTDRQALRYLPESAGCAGGFWKDLPHSTLEMIMNPQNPEPFVDEILRDIGACYGLGLVRLGGELGLYRSLHRDGPLSAAALARICKLDERYVREWLANQAASGYIEYDEAFDCYSMNSAQAAVLAEQDSPYFMLPAFDAAAGALANQDQVAMGFRNGTGLDWQHQEGCLFCAIAGFFRPGYEANLVQNWLPALDGVVAKLERGAKVADVGCGHGISTCLMAQAFPNSEFIGFDFHDQSVQAARDHARQHRSPGNLRFDTATAKSFPGCDYDLITCFDCLHDMGDPVGAAEHVQRALKPDGTWMIVEPFAGDCLADNLNPVGRIYYAASTMICIPTSKEQEVGLALGAQAGEKRLHEVVVEQGGFRSLRRATATPFNLVLEARPQ
jgi:2-polyprenyl-3-methyl-5-hydroxy-6-metoxy-1,4-benzoquinol methylase